MEQTGGGANTEILYGPSGDKLALLNGQSLQTAYIPLIGGAKATYNSSGLYYYRHSDWLGSSRLAVHASSRIALFDGAYAPFGEPYNYGSSLISDFSFTGQNQDTTKPSGQTGLYDFEFREYNSVQGRWVSPDPAGVMAVDITNPQTWNRYSYLANAPLSARDPLGLYCVWDDGSYDSSDDAETGSGEKCHDAGGNWFDGDPSDWGLSEDWSSQANPAFVAAFLNQTGSVTFFGQASAPYEVDSSGGGSQSSATAQVISKPCTTMDPFSHSVELTLKVGPEFQAGPLKLGTSMYKNVMTGASGEALEGSLGLMSAKIDAPTPPMGFGGGSPESNVYTFSVLGFQYDFDNGWTFAPFKDVGFGAQLGLGFEFSFNSDKFKRIALANAKCYSQGGGN